MIIAIKENDRVIVGYTNADELTKLSEEDYIQEENTPMAFTADGNFVAFSSLCSASDMLISDDNFLALEVSPKAIINATIPYIKQRLIESKNSPDSDDGYWGNSIVYVDGARIFDIDPRFGFCEIDDMVLHGYDIYIIKSVIDATEGLSAENRITKACAFTSKLAKSSLFPLTIVDTKTREIKHIMKGEIE